MNVSHQVVVLNEERLRSELAMFVWTQSQITNDRRAAVGGEPRDETDFHSSKANLYAGVLKLAGSKLKMADLIAQLTSLVAVGTNKEIHQLDPQLMAVRISTRATD